MKNLLIVFLRTLAFGVALFTLPRLFFHFFFPVYIDGEVYPSLEQTLVSGFRAGLIFSILAVLVHVLYVRYRAKYIGLTSDQIDYDTHQKIEVSLQQPLTTVFERLKNKLSSRWKVVYEDRDKGLIKFKVKHPWQVVDALVTVQLTAGGSDNTRIQADSKILSLFRLTDNGRSLQNVYTVRQVLLS